MWSCRCCTIGAIASRIRAARRLRRWSGWDWETGCITSPTRCRGGQQQRVAIARALVNRPALVLADEPTGNLDSHTSVEVISLFQELNEQGITVVLVTHEPDIARYAKRVVTMRDGRVLADKPVLNPHTVWEGSGVLKRA